MPGKLISLLQITDSFFPTGAFTQSYGLETYIQQRLISSREELKEFLVSYINEAVAACDAPAMLLAYRAAQQGDFPEIIELCRIISALKSARESRAGSTGVGRRLLETTVKLFPAATLERFHKLASKKQVQCHYCIVFGLVGQVLGIGEKDLAAAFIYKEVVSMVGVAVRIIPIGQNDGQWVIKELATVMEKAVVKSAALVKEELGSIAVGLEIKSMQHEHLYSRLFIS